MGLFWYPDRHAKFDFDTPFDKNELMQSYITYYLDRLQSMFKWSGLPDSIPQKWLEHYLLVNGSCVFIMDGDDLIVTTGQWGGLPDRYYIPTEYIVSNPYVKEATRKTYTIGEDCVLARNDVYARGLMPMLSKYCSMLVENDISLNLADILSRAMLTISAVDQQQKESVEQWLKKLRKGELSAIGELPQMIGNQDRGINITPFQSVAGTLTDLIEYHQYLKAGLFNELGLNSNYNMKREAINSNESQLNDDMLHPFIDDMLAMRKEACEAVNEMFGTSISVDFDSAWKDNETENEAIIEAVEAQSDLTANETDNIEEVQETEDAQINEAENEETAEETITDTDETMPETDILPETDIVEAIETLTEAVEDVAAELSDDTDKDGEINEDA